jgi:hypothetical protein
LIAEAWRNTLKNKALRNGLVLFVSGITVLVIERITNTGISKIIAKLYCGERYMQIPAQPGDGMCGFNMDMVVGMLSFLVVLAGFILIIIGLVKLINRRFKK